MNNDGYTPSRPGMPIPSGMIIGKSWSAPQPPDGGAILGIRKIDMSEDHTFYLASSSGLSRYDEATETWHQLYKENVWQVAAVSAQLVYFVAGMKQNIQSADASGNITTLPAPPENNGNLIISAASDGTLWLMGGPHIYSYNTTSKTWIPIDTGGHMIDQFGVGSASSACCIGSTPDGSAVLFLADGKWTVDNYFGENVPQWVGGTADQTAWAVESGTIFRKMKGQSWQIMDSVDPGSIAQVAAGSGHRLFLNIAYYNQPASSPNFPYNMITLQCFIAGVAYNAPEGWPAMNDEQLIGYKAISNNALIDQPHGIRKGYTNSNNPFSDWLSEVLNMKQPDGIKNPNNWTSIQKQITNELDYVKATNNLFANIRELTQDVAITNAQTLPGVGDIVGISIKAHEDTTLSMILGALFSAALGAIVKAITGPAGVVASLIVSGINDGIKAANGKKPHLPPNYELKVAYGQVSEMMAQLFAATNTANAQSQSTILQDWGKLSFTGKAAQNQWAWPTLTTAEIAGHAKNAFEAFFYQALIPTKWQIIHFDWPYVVNGPYLKSGNSPDYDALIMPGPVVQGLGDTNRIWIFNGLNASTNFNHNMSPFPAKAMFDGLESAGVDLFEMFSGYNGWSGIKRVTSS